MTAYKKLRFVLNPEKVLESAEEDATKRIVKKHPYTKFLSGEITYLKEAEKAGKADDYQKRKLKNLQDLNQLYSHLNGPLKMLRGDVHTAQTHFLSKGKPIPEYNLQEMKKQSLLIAKELEDHKQKHGAEIYRNVARISDHYLKEAAKKPEKKAG
jgi:hypothetical protein